MGALQQIRSSDDPRLMPYRELKDKTLAARFGLFVVEGEQTVRRLLNSPLKVHSLLMTPQRFTVGAWPLDCCPIYLADVEILSTVVGFDFHRGVLALGYRPEISSLDQLTNSADPAPRLLVLPEINDPTNLGALLRTAASFGWNQVLIGASCSNPYCRRTVRTAMAALFRQSFYRLESPEQLAQLRKYGYSLHATVPQGSAVPIQDVDPPERVAVLFGNEANGLPSEWSEACDLQVRIPMQPGVDSLNVAVAAGIVLAYYSGIFEHRRNSIKGD